MDELKKLTELTELTDDEVASVKMANATTRPNASGFYGGGGLREDQVKALFDAYPDKLRKRLNEVILFANALLKTLNAQGDEITTATESLKFLTERVGDEEVSKDPRFTSDALANAILTLSEDLRNTDEELRKKYDQIVKERGVTSVEYDNKSEVITFTFADGTSTAIDLPVESLVKGLTMGEDGNIVLTLEGDQTVTVSTQVIADAIANEGLRLEGMINNKLDKMTGTSSKMRLYATSAEGNQVAVFVGVQVNDVVTRADKGNIILPPKSSAGAMEDSRYAAPLWYVEQYVDEAIASAGGGGSGGGTTVKVNGEAVSEFDADTKVDKLERPDDRAYVYAVGKDGVIALQVISDTQKGGIVQRTDGGNIWIPNMPSNDKHAVPKKYVDDKTSGIPSFGNVFWEGSLSKGQVGIENSYINIPLRITYSLLNTSVTDWRGTVTTNALSMGSETSSELSTPLFTVGSEVYRIVCDFWFTVNYDGNYEMSYSQVNFNCQKLNGSTWEDTTDIVVTKIEY